MHSTLNPKQADPHDVYVTAPDVVPAAHVDGGLYNSARDAMGLPPDPQAQMAQAHMGYETSAGPAVPPVDTTFRAAAVGNIKILRGQRSMGVRAMRGVIGFLLAVCVGVAGALWQSHGDVAQETVQQTFQQMIARWMPKFVATSAPAPESPAAADQPAPSTDQAATITTAAPQPASVAQTTPAGAAPDAAASDQSQLLQSMAQDLASAKQEIEQLKASVAQLKAGQDQMSREVARVTDTKASDIRPPEPAPRPRVPPPPRQVLGAPPRPLAPPVRRPPPPPPPLRSSQAAVAPIPLQSAPSPPPVARQPEPLPMAPPPQQGEQMSSVLRPPMPVP